MKGLTCIKKMMAGKTYLLRFVSALSLILVLSSYCCHAVSAVDNVPFTVYWRSYSINGQTPVNDRGYVTTSVLSRVILQNEPATLKNLYGVSLEFAVSDNTNFQNKLLTVEVIVSQNTEAQNTWVVSLQHSYVAVSTNFGDIASSSGCLGHRLSNRQVKYTCSITVTGSPSINNAQVVLGTIQNATSSSQVIAYTHGNVIGSNADLILSSLSYTLTGTNDPTFDQNQTIISQNQTIISQNQQQIDQENQDREDIQNNQESAANAGAEAGDDAEQGGQTLIAAFTSLVAALGQVHQTNCELPNFQIYGMKFENMNLCAVSVPQELAALGALLMVFLIVPLGVNVVKRIIALYNELIGGK